MAGLIARLFGGGGKQADPNPLPGIGGYDLPAGRLGEGGFPGSTSLTRTFRGATPRSIGIRADTNTGTQTVDVTRAQMQRNNPTEFYGGQPLRTMPGANNIGGNPLGRDGAPSHSVRDTETPMIRRQPQIGLGTPGSNNVRNSTALRYKNTPGQLHTYMSRPRADQATPNPTGQASDGNVHPGAVSQPVTVQNRFVFAGGGQQTWWMEREMPYGGRGDGARGAYLNGLRYYAEGGYDNFGNAGAGAYGQRREAGVMHRPTYFTTPAPWSSQTYDTTAGVGTYDTPGPSDQVVQNVYVSPEPSRANYAATRANNG